MPTSQTLLSKQIPPLSGEDASSPDKQGRRGERGRARGGRDAVSLLVKVLHNVQVSIHSMHMRYEDATSSPGSPFAIGVTLDEIAAFTTDAHGNRAFSADTSVQHKWVELKQLGLYHHVNCTERMPVGTSLESLIVWVRTPGLQPWTSAVARKGSPTLLG